MRLWILLWQSNEFVDDNTLTVNINRLRKKLETIGANKYLQPKSKGIYYYEMKSIFK